ncbi:discoidin domain-containing protein [Geothrix sp. PMB-07]|uniref:glycosyl hydrolase 2 galactose-binding domain-containing protein n=1 Tax=Geothrix sp. PMB-07 TaxID=3068640 RepID=UPI002740D5FE|nr:discoidin domain-containing protein [Geothrix sp. PMB-07]WLT30907.1 discoidin domain-containing protein [Geothrix sp. PMB-07]
MALHRPALQSSAWDYNLTAQLVTDGIITNTPPTWFSFASSERGTFKKHQRERLFDGNWVTEVELKGSALLPVDASAPWIRLDFGGALPEVDAMQLTGVVKGSGNDPETWGCLLQGTDDGNAWRTLGEASGKTRLGGNFTATIAFPSMARCQAYRIHLRDPRARQWILQEWNLTRQGQEIPVGGPQRFCSAWKSAGRGEEWVSVDLGAPARVDQVTLHWIRRPLEGRVELSQDGIHWNTAMVLPSSGERDDLRFHPKRARHVRIWMAKAATEDGYILSECEIWGTGGLVPISRPQPTPSPNGNLELTMGAWRLARESQVQGSGAQVSQPGFCDDAWLPATVPGTVLASYVAAGAVADPTYGDQQLAVSDSYFYADFWYRNTFTVPVLSAGQRRWLCFDGINWKAEVYLNGVDIGRIEGAFSRKRFDVTDQLIPGHLNALAVRIVKNDHPGSVKEKTFEEPGENGGVLGCDNPTFHASIGWDWIPSIRGRNTGIWDRVRLLSTGPVTLERPEVTIRLPLPDTSTADVALAITVVSGVDGPVMGRLVGHFGEVVFEQAVSLGARERITLHLDPATNPSLRLQNPRLWWPNGYGKPELYGVELSFIPEGATRPSDTCCFQAGVRQFKASDDGNSLRLWVNGRRFIPKGGNWGFSESLLRYREREFDAALAYHRDMHFNMVRNWLGMVGQDAFYEACDRNGIVIWQDFWLANPWDGDDPASTTLFLANAAELVNRVRTHASLGLYCGRNEGYPPLPIEQGIRSLLAREHPGAIFVPNSADGVVGGYGPYHVYPLETYGTTLARAKLHSEMGMPSIPSLESLRLMMPEADLWPPGRLWGLHDFTLAGAQGGTSFLDQLRRSYGHAGSVEEWIQQAQFLCYDGYRAMFEGQNQKRMGLLIWMSHPAWPSLVWQTYDYYLEPTAAYFGAKKACEPLHIQWHESSDRIQVVNTGANDHKGLSARAQLYRFDGTLVWEKMAHVDSTEDSTQDLFAVERPLPLTPAYLLRLTLEGGGTTLSRNDYLRGRESTDTQAINSLPSALVDLRQSRTQSGDKWILKGELRNSSATIALGLMLSVHRDRSDDRILPALFTDNFLTLLPGESREVCVEVRHEDCRGESPILRLRGFNLLRTQHP